MEMADAEIDETKSSNEKKTNKVLSDSEVKHRYGGGRW